ncbi:MAG TPA: glycosyltransferase, partial [Thermoanaerobaculia bacterium]|nr:glycosyltransferase [Thermoanaerobaculia bacterium]
MRILVATNNWWLGGRETFVATLLEQLNVRADLLATLIDRDVPGLHLFDSAVATGQEPYAQRWASWLARGAELIERARPDAIWAHHFELLPAWVLSRLHGVPLLATFHGPIVGAGRPNDLMQSLGITLAVHRGDAVTGVSEEILDGLRSLAPDLDARLLPNT